MTQDEMVRLKTLNSRISSIPVTRERENAEMRTPTLANLERNLQKRSYAGRSGHLI